MNLSDLQAELRHFAAEREWQPFHTPKNLTTALIVEAAELAEIFQWRTPDESRLVHEDAATRQRIGEEVADVLLYLLQVADHCQIDVSQAVRDKLERNAIKYPAKHVIPRVSPGRAAVAGTHVLLDYENVQPSDAELRALVPDASQVWVFHGPHQREVEKRFASFGAGATPVPISKTGKNALDFHLSFYMGYIASRNPESTMVVVANDKGYEPMLEHAKAMGFRVRRQPHGEVKPPARKAAAKKVVAGGKTAAKKVAAKQLDTKAVDAKPVNAKPVNAKQVDVKQVDVKQVGATRRAAAKKVVATSATASQPTARKAAARSEPAKTAAPAKAAQPPRKSAPSKKVADRAPVPAAAQPAAAAAPAVAKRASESSAVVVPDSAATLKKLTDSLRKMGDKRPTKPASLRRWLKSFLGVGTTDEAVETALARLITAGVMTVASGTGASYPIFDASTASTAPRT